MFYCGLNFCSRDLGAEHFIHICLYILLLLRCLFMVVGKKLSSRAKPLSFASITDSPPILWLSKSHLFENRFLILTLLIFR